MKKIAIIFVFMFVFSATFYAQENQNIKKETTTKVITVKDTAVNQMVIEDVDMTTTIVELEGTGKKEQSSTEKVVEDKTKREISVDTKPNEQTQQVMGSISKKKENPETTIQVE